MSEPLPPLPPLPSEPPPPSQNERYQPKEPPYDPPDFWVMFFIGIGLAVATGVACVAMGNILPVGLAFWGVIASLFFKGWRGIFAGYFTAIGLAVLAVIVICGTMIVGSHSP